MSATGKDKVAAAAKRPARESKVKAAPKEKKQNAPKAASHPTYFQMIKEALLALSERSGSSPYAIAKYMEEKHKGVLPANFRKILGLQLKNSEARGKLIKIKASYKLSDAGKKSTTAVAEKKPANKANAVKKTTTKPKPKEVKKKADTVKKAAAKKSTKTAAGKITKKRSAPSPAAKAKQPKSIKSPAKKAKKASAV